MHLADGDSGIVPQVFLYTEGCVKSFLFKTKYGVLKRKQRTSHKWNQNVLFQFFRTSKFQICLYHKKLMGEVKRVGHGTVSLDQAPLAQPFTIELDPDIQGLSKKPTVTLQIDYRFPPYPKAPLTLPFEILYAYLTYNPPLSNPAHMCSLDSFYLNGPQKYYTIITKYSSPCLIGKSAAANSRVFCGPAGFTPVLRINRNKLLNSVLTFLVSSSHYAGQVTVNVIGVRKESKKDGIYYIDDPAVKLLSSVSVDVQPKLLVSTPIAFAWTGKELKSKQVPSFTLHDTRGLADFERNLVKQFAQKPCWRRIMGSVHDPFPILQAARLIGVSDLSQLAVIWGWKKRVESEEEANGKLNVFVHVFDDKLSVVDSICPKRPIDKRKALNGLIKRHKKNPYLLNHSGDSKVKFKDHANVAIDLAGIGQNPNIFALVFGVTSTTFGAHASKFWKTYLRMTDPVTKSEVMFYPYRITNAKADGFVVGALIFRDDVWQFYAINCPCYDTANSETISVSRRQLVKLCNERFPDIQPRTSSADPISMASSDNQMSDHHYAFADESDSMHRAGSLPPGALNVPQDVHYPPQMPPASMGGVRPPPQFGNAPPTPPTSYAGYGQMTGSLSYPGMPPPMPDPNVFEAPAPPMGYEYGRAGYDDMPPPPPEQYGFYQQPPGPVPDFNPYEEFID